MLCGGMPIIDSACFITETDLPGRNASGIFSVTLGEPRLHPEAKRRGTL
jgi:hypothetical protein